MMTSEDNQDVTMTENVEPSNEVQNEVKEQQNEGEQQESKKNDGGPPPNHPRFNKIYGRMKGAEEENRQLVDVNQKLLEKIESLESNFNNFQAETKEQKQNETLAQIETRMNEAFENSDFETFEKTKKELNEALKNRNETNNNQQQQTVVNQTQFQQDLATFQAYNPWFNSNQQMTNKAHEIDAQMKNDPNWANKPNHEFLFEVGRRTQQFFNLTENNYANSSMSAGVVGDAGDQPITKDPLDQKVEQMTGAQKNVALKLFPGISEKEAYKKYAKNM
jgi:hypothetical protein